MWAVLLRNPLASALGVFLVLALVLGGVQSWRLGSAQTALAEEKLAFTTFKQELAQASLKVVTDAADESKKQLADLKTQVDKSNAATVTAIAGIKNAKSTGACALDPAYLATIDGVAGILGSGK